MNCVKNNLTLNDLSEFQSLIYDISSSFHCCQCRKVIATCCFNDSLRFCDASHQQVVSEHVLQQMTFVLIVSVKYIFQQWFQLWSCFAQSSSLIFFLKLANIFSTLMLAHFDTMRRSNLQYLSLMMITWKNLLIYRCTIFQNNV